MNTSQISVEEVLEAFLLEADESPATLQRYLREYPQFADDLIDLSSEIFLFSNVEKGDLLDTDHARIESALAQFRSTASRAPRLSLERLESDKQRGLATSLGVPRQVILAFVERCVIASSVPRHFLMRMAAFLRSNIDELVAYLDLPPQPMARSAKANDRPQEARRVSFEQLLREAGVSSERIGELLKDEP